MRPRLLLTAFALLFFTAPLLLLAAGSRPKPFENRAPAPRPSLAQGWDVFEDATRYLTEHLPLRERAVDENTRIAQKVFGYTPRYGAREGDGALPFGGAGGTSADGKPGAAPGVPPGMSAVEGKKGWLYIQQDFNYACDPPLTPTVAVARWEKLAEAIRATGRTVNIMVGPDKATLYSEFLPDGNRQLACRQKGSDALWAAIKAGGPGFEPDLLALLRAARAEGGPQPLYFRKDTHWNEVGALVGTKALLAGFSKTVKVDDSDVVIDTKRTYEGDLSGMLGLKEFDVSPNATIFRPDAGSGKVTNATVAGADVEINRRVGAKVPVVEDKVLMVDDSFSWSLRPQITQYLRQLTSTGYPLPAKALATLVAQNDHIVFETVEREFINRAAELPDITAADIEAAERALPAKK